MHNLCANQVRKSSSRGTHICLDNESVSEAEYAISTGQLGMLEVRDLDYALQRLAAEQRAVVLLVGREEMGCADVALPLDIPVDTVMSRLSRGWQRLMALMDWRTIRLSKRESVTNSCQTA